MNTGHFYIVEPELQSLSRGKLFSPVCMNMSSTMHLYSLYQRVGA